MQPKILETMENLGFVRITNSDDDVINFIHQIQNNEHCILIFQNETIRDKIVKEYFHPKGISSPTTGCFTQNLSKYNCTQKMTYDDLIENNSIQSTKISEFLVTLLDKSYPNSLIRVACEDTAWFSEGGFFEEHQKCGSQLNKKVLDDLSILCCYNETKLDNDKLKVVLSSREYIILENPFSVFKKMHSDV